MSKWSYSHTTIEGHLGGKPEVWTGGDKQKVSFSVAQNFGERVQWTPVVIWGDRGNFARDYLNKGAHVLVAGRFESRQYEDKDGNKRVAWELNAREVQPLDKKPQEDEI